MLFDLTSTLNRTEVLYQPMLNITPVKFKKITIDKTQLTNVNNLKHSFE